VRHVHDRDAESLKQAGVDFNVSLIFGGQIKGEGMRLFQVYSAGNFIEATPETPYFQIGESKYGKPVLDRVSRPTPRWTRPPSARWCRWTRPSSPTCRWACRWTWWSTRPTAETDKVVCIDENNPYFKMLHNTWGQKLREVFDSIEDPVWDGAQTDVPLMVDGQRSKRPAQDHARRKKS
jgi:putative proteasome-type protease